ncbi:peptide ABC transporter substrate-binding protein [TM7 phylum sp. oral taxon 350]|nr:peptide ABC transporter substrate-binding protein [TM7 phylum sp. oral taxon 350]
MNSLRPKKKKSFKNVKKTFQNISKEDLKTKADKLKGASQKHVSKFVVKRWDSISNARLEIITWLVIVFGIIFLSGIQLSVIQNNFMQETSIDGGTYVEGTVGTIKTLNPLYASNESELALSRIMFSSLFKMDNTGHLNTDLVKKYSISEDGKTYTLELKKNVKWHDGEVLKANDVVFTFNLMQNQEARTVLGSNWKNINKIKVQSLGDEIVKFELPLKFTNFINSLTFPIVPEHILADVKKSQLRENNFSSQPIGTGAFKFNKKQQIGEGISSKTGDDQGYSVTMVSNNDYYEGKPKLDSFRIQAYPTKEELLKAINNNDVNAAGGLNPQNIKELTNKSLDVVEKPLSYGVYSIFNTVTSQDLKEIKFRRALQFATNTDELRKSLGMKTALYSPFIAGQIPEDSIEKPEYNVEKAKKLLEELEYKEKDGSLYKGDRKVSIEMVATTDDQMDLVADILAKEWKSLGIDVKVNKYSLSDPSQNFVGSVLQTRAYDVIVYKYAITDPDVFAYWHSSQGTGVGMNLAGYTSAVANDFLVSSRTAKTSDVKLRRYIGFAKQWQQDVPAIGLYQDQLEYVKTKNSSAFSGDTKLNEITDRFNDVYKWRIEKGLVRKTP